MKKPVSLYIHIPFCVRKCLYCDFLSFGSMDKYFEDYVNVLCEEIKQNASDYSDRTVSTIFIGGGTPTILKPKEIGKIMDAVMAKYDVADNAEITIESNPGTMDRAKLNELKQMYINRLSIGLQAWQDRLLKRLGRIHSYEDFRRNYIEAREIGFKNINVDLMLGLPNQSIEDLKESIENVIDLQPEHISIYSLIVEEGTKLYKQIETGELQLSEEELEREMYWYTKSKLELAGYKHYEISNYAKPKRESKHNSNCWEQKQYIGIGAAAHSYLNNVRYCNVSNLEEYISNMTKSEVDFEDKYIVNERQSLEDRKNEFMLLGLRKIDGVSISKFKEKYVENPIFKYRDSLEKLVNDDLVQIDGDVIRLTNKGLDLANIVWEEFI